MTTSYMLAASRRISSIRGVEINSVGLGGIGPEGRIVRPLCADGMVTLASASCDVSNEESPRSLP